MAIKNNAKLNSRQISIELLGQIKSTLTLKEAFETKSFTDLSEDAKPFVKFLVTQTVRYHNVFVHIIDQYLEKKPQNKFYDFVYAVLSLGACELLLSHQKSNITLNSYTEIVKINKKTTHLTGIIRAILGKIDKNNAQLTCFLTDYKLIFGDELYYHIQNDYPDHYDNIFQGLLTEPSTDIVKLHDFEVPIGYQEITKNLMRFQSGNRPETTDYFKNGHMTIQSFASYLPIHCAGDIKGKRLLDLCAAPGGKTIQAAALNAQVTAVDISAKRLTKLQDNLNRCHLTAHVITQDALLYQSDILFDIVLLDAPCSATGTIRKNPDIIHNFSLENMYKLQELQNKMLDHAAQLVALNGILIYSVCSLSKAEGENQINNFLKKHENFKLIEPNNINDIPTQGFSPTNHYIRLLPLYDDNKPSNMNDGFFIAYLKKLNIPDVNVFK